MKPTVYLDSSVPSYWLEPASDDPIIRARHLIIRRWWDEELGRFEVRISQYVLDELAQGDSLRATRRLELVKQFASLDISDSVIDAADFYMANFAMPRRDARDAFHIAFASVYEVDYLLTWNYAHLANASKRKHIETLNQRLRLISPVICSPEELMLESRE
ncbi:MAG TPA: type II toxin-antitoxin system VapC family toxin [Phycisphaerae bacterium]|nr:type II toxin-antitoxin system VapC family toxin [Phycisphaerae bacterium]